MFEEYLFKTVPYQHQIDALDESYDEKVYALFMEMGCGKSKVVIDNFANLYLEDKINTVLIIAPKGVYDNWYSKEIPAHLPEKVDHYMVKWSPSTSKKNLDSLSKVYESGSKHLRIFIMNVEALSTKKGTGAAAKFINSGRCMFIVDESTTIKNHKAKRTVRFV